VFKFFSVTFFLHLWDRYIEYRPILLKLRPRRGAFTCVVWQVWSHTASDAP